MNDDPQIDLSHEAASQALEAFFVDEDHDKAFDGVPAWQVHRHLAGCEVCRRQYDGMALADRLLASGAGEADEAIHAPRGGFETGFAEASFMGALDQMLDEERSEKGADTPGSAEVVDLGAERSRRMQVIRQLSLVAAVLLVAGASWYAFDQSQNPNKNDNAVVTNYEFQPRSAAATDQIGPFEQPSIELFCAERTPDGVQFTGTKDAPFGLLSCPQDAELKLAYDNPSTKLRHAAFFGVSQKGSIYWYGPTPADMDAVEVVMTDALAPFGESIRLSVNHEPGKVRVIGLFAAEPVDFPALERVIEHVGAKALYEGTMPDELGIRGTMTSSSFEVIDGEASHGGTP